MPSYATRAQRYSLVQQLWDGRYSCKSFCAVHADNETETHIPLMRQAPRKSAGIEQLTCRMIDCPLAFSITLYNAMYFSKEPTGRSDPATNSLGYKPAAYLANVKRTKKGKHGLYGLGEDASESYCLECAEAMMVAICAQGSKIKLASHDGRFHALFAIAQSIFADARIGTDCPGLSRPHPTLRHALKKWKAVIRKEQLQTDLENFQPFAPEIGNFELCEGDDKESVYISQETSGFEVCQRDGTPAMLTAADIRGKALREVVESARNLLYKLVLRGPKHDLYVEAAMPKTTKSLSPCPDFGALPSIDMSIEMSMYLVGMTATQAYRLPYLLDGSIATA